MNNLTVLVLAGGEGKRFWPFTTNKILFPFLGKPLFDFSVKNVLPKETSQIIIVTSPTNDGYFKSLSLQAPLATVIQPSPNGMANAIESARKEIGSSPVLILIADDLFDPSLPQNIIETAEKTEAFGVMPGWNVSSYFPGGYLNIEGKRVKSIVEKPGAGNEPSSFVNISGHFIRDSSLLFAALDKVQTSGDDRYEQALSLLMADKEFVMHEYTGTFTSLKYPWHVLDGMDMLLKTISSHRGEHCEIKQNVYIDGPVYLGNNVRIFENTKIVGPCYIGDNTIVGNNNVIRHSIIEANCVTGFNTDITRSYIGESSWFHSNYIGDSILEGNVSMGSGSVLANLRLDEGDIYSIVKGEKTNTSRNKLGAIIGKNVRLGVNTSIMPGIKIGGGSMIGAGLTISQDIPDESYVVGRTEVSIEHNTKFISDDRDMFKKKL